MRRDRLDATAIAIMVLLCALWGSQQVVIKISMAQGLPPVLQSTLRAVGAACLGCLWIAWRQGREPLRALLRRNEATGPGLVLAVIFGVEFVMIYVGLGRTTASRAVLLLYTAPFFTALAAHFFLPAERLGLVQVAGLVLAFAGVAAAFADGLLHGGGDLAGDALNFAAAAMWGCTNVFIKRTPALRRVDASWLLVMQFGGAVPIMLACSLAFGELNRFPDATALAWLGLVYQTVVVGFASYLVWFWMLLAYPAAKVSGFTFLAPVFGILSGGLVLGEPMTVALLFGLAAIAAGLLLVNRQAPA